MTALRSPFVILLAVLLTAMWCVLWGEASVANVVSGLVLAVGCMAIVASESEGHSVRPIPLAKFLAVVAVDLVKSTVAVAVEVLTPTDRTEERIIVVDLAPERLAAPLMMSVAITITPGTAVVDVDLENDRLYLHLLYGQRADDSADQARRLNRLANEALPFLSERPERQGSGRQGSERQGPGRQGPGRQRRVGS